MREDIRFLRRLILMAVQGGYKNLGLHTIYRKIDMAYIVRNEYYQLVFDVDFMAALWGDKDHYLGKIQGYSCPKWKYKLRRMVCVHDPLAFLKEEFHGLYAGSN